MIGFADPRLRLTGSCLAWLCVCLFWYSPNAWGASGQSIVDSTAFERRYQAYAARTANRPIDLLNAYLDSTIENVFLDASQVSPTALTAEVRHFKKVLFKTLQAQLCRDGSLKAQTEDELKIIFVHSSASAAEASAVNPSPSDHGRIAGIVANIIEQTKNRGFCRRRSFADLE